MPYGEPFSDATEGVTKGTLDYVEEKIKTLARKFLDRKLIFINRQETVDLVKEQLKSGEWSLCKQYIKNKELRLLVQLGLALRKLERDPPKLHDLKDKIVMKYKTRGLHTAELVQNKILGEFIGNIANRVSSVSEIVEKVESLLLNVEKYVIFVKSNDDVKKRVQEVVIKIQANNPDVLILFSSKSAMHICMQMKKSLEKTLRVDYSIELKQEKERLLIFIFRMPHALFGDKQK